MTSVEHIGILWFLEQNILYAKVLVKTSYFVLHVKKIAVIQVWFCVNEERMFMFGWATP